jgi:hypothetical protein
MSRKFIKRMLEVAAQVLRVCPPLDRLPYTPEWDKVYEEFVNLYGRPISQSECWACLIHVRKTPRNRRG